MRLAPCMLATVCVPWNEDFTVSEGLFRREVRHLLSTGFENLYIFGTAGEGYAVTDAMFRHIAGAFHDEMQASQGFCQLGVIGLSVPQVKARIDIGLELGFRAFQISLPSWGEVNQREMFTFFDEVLGAYPQAQFLHYNLIRGLHIVTGKEYARILSDHPNLVATKSGRSSIHQDLDLIRNAPELCHFLTEFDYAYASLFGTCGLLVSMSAINARKARTFYQAGQACDVETLVTMTREYQTILDLLMSHLASGQHMDGAYDKLFVKIPLPDFPLRLLPPYQGTTDEEFTAFVEALTIRLPDWI